MFDLCLPRRRSAAALCLCLVAAVGCGRGQPLRDPPPTSRPLTLFAAASTAGAVEEIGAKFSQQHGTPLRTNCAGSSTLARQILHGAEADLFLSAHENWADELAQAARVAKRRDLLSNELVVVVAHDSKLEIKRISDLERAAVRRIALADPESVPAGIYARQAITKLGLWDRLKPKVVAAADVRQALAFVETQAADAGIVFATDARASAAVRMALEVDTTLYGPVRYPLVLVRRKVPHPAAQAFYDFLCGPTAAAIFRRHGFEVLGEPPVSP